MYSVCRSIQQVWRRSLSKEEPSWGIFCPAMDPTLDGPGRNTTTLVEGHEYFIPSFVKNQSSASGEELENLKSLRPTTTTDRWTTPNDYSSLEPSAQVSLSRNYTNRSNSKLHQLGKIWTIWSDHFINTSSSSCLNMSSCEKEVNIIISTTITHHNQYALYVLNVTCRENASRCNYKIDFRKSYN